MTENIAVARLVGTIDKTGEGKFLLNAGNDLAMRIIGDTELPVGTKVQVIGTFDPDRSGGAEIVASKIVKVAKKTPDEALAKIVAKVFRSHRHLEPKAGKQAVGFGTLVWGDLDAAKFARYVAFDPLSSYLARGKLNAKGELEYPPAERGAIMELIGSLRKRYFVRKDGKPGTGIDIVANEGLTKVLKASESADPFADIAPTPSMAADAPSDEVPF